MSMAAAVDAGRHVLAGVLAEPRGAMVRRMLRRGSPWEALRRYGARFLVRRALGALREAAIGRARGVRRVSTPVTTVRALNGAETVALLAELAPDAIVVANAPVLKPEVFGAAAIAAVNFHSGRLPEFGGVASEFWALYEGCDEAWATLHRVEAALDSGAILAEQAVAVERGDTPESLHERLVACGAGLLNPLLDRLAAGPVPAARDPGPARLRPWPTPAQQRELRRRQTTMR
jgi:methionyl-tRNA formyltransferase